MFLATQVLSLVLNFCALLSEIRSAGSWLYHLTDDQHQLLLARPSSQFSTEGLLGTPASAKAASEAAACQESDAGRPCGK